MMPQNRSFEEGPRHTGTQILKPSFTSLTTSDLFVAADQLLNDSSVDFLFLHLPMPHPGGIYDRKTSSFTTHNSSYIDNLALADKSLAHLRHQLEQNGEWDSSAILVMGDHSWRTTLFWSRIVPSGHQKIRAASHGGQFDDRPAYIVKLPNQQTARPYRRPVRRHPYSRPARRHHRPAHQDPQRPRSLGSATALTPNSAHNRRIHPQCRTGIRGHNPLP